MFDRSALTWTAADAREIYIYGERVSWSTSTPLSATLQVQIGAGMIDAPPSPKCVTTRTGIDPFRHSERTKFFQPCYRPQKKYGEARRCHVDWSSMRYGYRAATPDDKEALMGRPGERSPSFTGAHDASARKWYARLRLDNCLFGITA